MYWNILFQNNMVTKLLSDGEGILLKTTHIA